MTEAWKVFIKGVQGRGDEVIKMLEGLGAVNHWNYMGDGANCIYHIRHDGYIDLVDYKAERAQIIMDNYREIKLPELWQDGDILVDNDDPNRFVVKSNAWTGPWENHFKAHLLVNPTSIGESPIAIFCNADYHKADSEELRKFHELLHKHGKEWDAEKKQLVDWQWKPEEEEDYFFVSSDLSVEVTSNDGFDIDEDRIRCGNFFRTREKAEAAAERVKKALKGE